MRPILGVQDRLERRECRPCASLGRLLCSSRCLPLTQLRACSMSAVDEILLENLLDSQLVRDHSFRMLSSRV